MQPNQPPPAPPPVSGGPPKDANPYDFLQTSSGKQPKFGGGPTLPTGNSTLQRLLIFIGIFVFIIVAAVVFMNVLGSSDKEKTSDLISLVKQQNELIRVSDIGIAKAKSSATKDFALITKLSLQSDQPELIQAIKDSGTKVNDKLLAGGQDSKTDDALTQAEQVNNFDTVFMQTTRQGLANYQLALKKAYDSAKSKKLKDLINTDNEHINTILGPQAK